MRTPTLDSQSYYPVVSGRVKNESVVSSKKLKRNVLSQEQQQRRIARQALQTEAEEHISEDDQEEDTGCAGLCHNKNLDW
ncbi:hypothetical protein K7432_011709 [Basidiobolus ranarum]|uniref:Uncharacterized protein n=1 Tax=Basidiobolus ranarum TaxID=34480 RepID=A0ABR2VTW8_9FUNG